MQTVYTDKLMTHVCKKVSVTDNTVHTVMSHITYDTKCPLTPSAPLQWPGNPSVWLQNPAAMKQLVEAEDACIVCLQETKLQDKAVEQMEALMGLTGWHHAWNCSTAKKGYSGTAIISK